MKSKHETVQPNIAQSPKHEIGKMFLDYYEERKAEKPTKWDREELHLKYARKVITFKTSIPIDKNSITIVEGTMIKLKRIKEDYDAMVIEDENSVRYDFPQFKGGSELVGKKVKLILEVVE